MSNKKTSKNILLAIMGVLILAELIIGIMTIQTDYLVVDIIKLIPLVMITLYGFWLYKKPHGNMLKYAMLLMAIAEILIAISGIKDGWGINGQTVRIFASAIIIYVAGRLNRIEQNKYLLPIAFAIQLARGINGICSAFNYTKYTPVYLFTWFNGAIVILTLMIAYFVRYKEHKEAGLMDAPKK